MLYYKIYPNLHVSKEWIWEFKMEIYTFNFPPAAGCKFAASLDKKRCLSTSLSLSPPPPPTDNMLFFFLPWWNPTEKYLSNLNKSLIWFSVTVCLHNITMVIKYFSCVSYVIKTHVRVQRVWWSEYKISKWKFLFALLQFLCLKFVSFALRSFGVILHHFAKLLWIKKLSVSSLSDNLLFILEACYVQTLQRSAKNKIISLVSFEFRTQYAK